LQRADASIAGIRLDSLRRHWQADRQWEPRWSADQRDEAHQRWRKAVTRSLDWVGIGGSRSSARL
jgi:glycerol kinase